MTSGAHSTKVLTTKKPAWKQSWWPTWHKRGMSALIASKTKAYKRKPYFVASLHDGYDAQGKKLR